MDIHPVSDSIIVKALNKVESGGLILAKVVVSCRFKPWNALEPDDFVWVYASSLDVMPSTEWHLCHISGIAAASRSIQFATGHSVECPDEYGEAS